MKRFLIIQFLELSTELILFFLVLTGAAMTLRSGTFLLADAISFTVMYWSAALFYRMILLQLPIVMVVKYCISRHRQMSMSVVVLINFIGLCTTYLLFDVFFGGAKVFFIGNALIGTTSLFLAAAMAPLLVVRFMPAPTTLESSKESSKTTT